MLDVVLPGIDGLELICRIRMQCRFMPIVEISAREGRLKKLLGTIHIYPTLADGNKAVAGEWQRAHQPERLLELVERFHTWRRGKTAPDMPVPADAARR